MTQPEIVVHATRFCIFCLRARLLLWRRGHAFRLVDVTGDPEARASLAQRTGRNTVPQIYVGDVLIGGFDDLRASVESGELDALLGGQSPVAG